MQKAVSLWSKRMLSFALRGRRDKQECFNEIDSHRGPPEVAIVGMDVGDLFGNPGEKSCLTVPNDYDS